MTFPDPDPDATPVDGTRAVRPRLTRPALALRPDGRIRRIGGAGRGEEPQGGPARTLGYVLGTLFVVLFAAFVVDVASPSAFNGLRNLARSPHSASGPHQRGRDSRPGTTTRQTAPKGPGPVLTGLSPQSAKPGTTVVVTGSGFFSANHRIVARVAGQPAPTSCPSSQRCLVVLPAAPKGASTATVQIVTEDGASNTLTIHYG